MMPYFHPIHREWNTATEDFYYNSRAFVLNVVHNKRNPSYFTYIFIHE